MLFSKEEQVKVLVSKVNKLDAENKEFKTELEDLRKAESSKESMEQ